MTKQRLGILGGMGRPTRLAPCGDPDDLICSGQMNCPGIKVLAFGQNACTRRKTRPICDGAPFVADREIYSSSEVSSRRVTFRFSSSNCLSSTKSGQLVMGSEAF